MVMITNEQFHALAAQGYNRIPVVREVSADLDTALSIYLKLANAPFTYLFESVQGGEKWGRYSIIGLSSHTVVRVQGREITVERDGTAVETHHEQDPLGWIEAFHQRYRVAELDGLPRFNGGLVGYFSYDTVRYIEPRLARCPNPDPLQTPDILLMVSDELVVYDNLAGKVYVIVHADPGDAQAWDKAQRRLTDLVEQLHQACLAYDRPVTSSRVEEQDFTSNMPRPAFEAAVDRIKEYIIAGDVMQVAMSQRFSIPLQARPLDVYRSLRGLNPSPYMYYLNLGDFYIVGSSPEILTRVEDGEIAVRPIAGTRPRGATDELDKALEQELLADPKERAEHLMLIDLGRNDVGRVAEVGSVHVTERMVIERYSHVMHIVSNVTGRLVADKSAMDVLRATFPAGTLTGAPKIRAMEIIDEQETVKRGVYAGAVGYLGWNGNMDMAIAIRTAVIKDGILSIQVGAGIVADSVPAMEWEETRNKARAMFKAVVRAQQAPD